MCVTRFNYDVSTQMKQIRSALLKFVVVIGTMQMTMIATPSANATQRAGLNLSLSMRGDAVISVLTYTVGGSRRRGHNAPQTVTNAVVRIKRPATGEVLREAKRTRNGHVVFSVSPGRYQIEAALEPPEDSPRRPCGTPKILRVHKGSKVLVKLYCSIP
jgi:hypothetical protein